MGNLNDVKVGDILFVTVTIYHGNNRILLSKVERVTKTLVIAQNYRYRKSDGSSISGLRHARLATEEDINKIQAKKEHDNLISLCKKLDFHKMRDEQLKEILKIATN